jgi:DNA-binding NtrC family response regulator
MITERCRRSRILFVDDEASIRLTLPLVLAKSWFDITVVGSLDDALAEIQIKKFDFLLSDLNMPQPNDGFAVHRSNAKSAASLHQFHPDWLSRR